jgi:hypothetical protein
LRGKKVCKNKTENIIEINDDSNDDNNNNIIHYWHEDFQLTKEDENILLDPNGWFSDQHRRMAMKILYINKLQSIGYEQHTYAIMGMINKIIQNSFQHIFINNNH